MFITLKKKSVLLAFTMLIVATVMLACGGGLAASVFTGGTLKKLPVYGVDTPDKKIALSFDAAWGADKTQGIIDILKKYDAKATFFLVGFWIEAYPDQVKAIDAAGLEIGNHSNNHLKMSTLGEEEISKEISIVNNQISDLVKKTPKFFRPPFGDYNNRLIEKVEAMGLTAIQWTVDSLDWKGISSTEITKRVCTKVTNGSIVLFHNNSKNILEALPIILLKLKNEGYQFVTMSELVYQDNYTIDNNGIQHKNN